VLKKNLLKTKNEKFFEKINHSLDFKAANKFYKNFSHVLQVKSYNNFGARLPLLQYRVQTVPTKIRRFTVLKSAHVHKSSRDQFEIRTYSRSYHVYVQNPSVYRFISMLNQYFLGENSPINLELVVKEVQSRKVYLSRTR
jgi:hypothetical protein